MSSLPFARDGSARRVLALTAVTGGFSVHLLRLSPVAPATEYDDVLWCVVVGFAPARNDHSPCARALGYGAGAGFAQIGGGRTSIRCGSPGDRSGNASRFVPIERLDFDVVLRVQDAVCVSSRSRLVARGALPPRA